MKAHQTIYENIKTILKDYFGEDINEYEDGDHITIGDTGVWISYDDFELTVGYGVDHRHYHCEIDNMKDAINKFQNILTRKKRITNYYKGEHVYKSTTEIENQNGDFEILSTSLTWFHPFWKKTKIETYIVDPIIDSPKVIKQIDELKEYA